MSKIKKRMLGLVLGMCLFGGSAGSCYAASGSVTVDVTASRVTGKFVYGEAGHQIKIRLEYQEKELSSGYTFNSYISDV